MHPVEAFIRERVNPPQAEIDAVIAKVKLRTLKPGEHFCDIGQKHHELGVLTRGKMRVFTLTEAGDDVTVDFIFPVHFVASVDAAISARPSEVGIEALEESELWVCPFSVRTELIEHGDRAWAKLNEMELEELFRRKNRYAKALQSKDAETRYREAMTEFPPALRKVRQYHLASYLGILPQSLSRIRARLRRKNKGT